MVTKDRILGKAWEAQLDMLVAGNKCWAGSVKKWLLENQPQEVAGLLPPVQSLLEMAPQPIVAHALHVEEPTTTCVLQVGTVQLLLGMAPKTTHIHPTCLAGVRGWAESQVLWCKVRNIRVRARMTKLAALKLVQPVGARYATRG
jgi:hypothetical protein